MGMERRDFHKLTLAALGGVLTGSLAGCGSGNTTTGGKGSTTTGGSASNTAVASNNNREVHLCHGLNACKNQGISGKNECAGQGDCATAKHHSCGEQNDCRNLGGCGQTAGKNECKGQGHCAVPLMEGAWKDVHAILEAKFTKEGKTLGKDPGQKKG